jgi:hypothetical protein
MTNEQYHADVTRISKSGLDQIDRSPAHYFNRYLDPNRGPNEQTEAMFLGTAVHAAILEPHLFEKNYHAINDIKKCEEIGGKSPRATKAYKEWIELQKQLHNGKIFISMEDFTNCVRMRDSVHAHPTAKHFLHVGRSEETILWTDPDTGAPCKCRPDRISDNTGFLLDIKTTEDASAEQFGRSCLNYRYDVQAPFYEDGFFEAYNQQPEGFAFIAVEKKAPYLTAVFWVPPHIYDLGKEKYKRNLETYMSCKKSGKWPGYSEDVQTLSLPGWAFKNQNNNN